MRLKLDENMPATLAAPLSRLGHDVDTVPGEQLKGAADEDVWAAARRAQRLLITQDLDFSDLRSFEPGSHAGILLVRLRNPPRRKLVDRVEALFLTEDVEQWHGCLLVATDTKLRIRRPPDRA